MDHSSARNALQAAADALDRHFAGRYFLIDGTLLGHVREGGFIAGDSDIDLGMRIEDFDERLVDDILQAGFTLYRRRGAVAKGLMLQFLLGRVRIDLMFFYRDGADALVYGYVRKNRLVARFADFALAAARFEGVDVMVPSPPERYLETAYGANWHLPVRVWDYRYATQNLSADGGPVWRAVFGAKRARWRRRHGDIHVARRTVFTDGVFDLLHANHIALLDEARALGDRLVVGVISDRIAASYKRLPVVPQDERLRMIEAVACVDRAVLLDDPLDEALMRRIVDGHHVGVVVYAGSATPEFYTYPEQIGIMRRLSYHEGVSTSDLVERIVARRGEGTL